MTDHKHGEFVPGAEACQDCGSTNTSIRQNGPHYELFCCDCLHFIRFVNKKKAERYMALKGQK